MGHLIGQAGQQFYLQYIPFTSKRLVASCEIVSPTLLPHYTLLNN